MNNLNAYVEYFRQLAVSHKDIQHDPETEIGKGDIEKKRFCMFGSEELVSSLRTQISFPALLIELYETITSSDSVNYIHQNPSGSFMILASASEQNNVMAEQVAYAKAEEIMFDIFKKIWQDVYGKNVDRCSTPFKSFRWNMEITPTGKLFQNQFGWYVQFKFEFQNTIDITKAPVDGTFL